MDFYDQVLKTHKATENEREKLLSKADSVLKKLRKELDKQNINAEVMLGGSAAKGTFVKNDFDCDVFVRFSPEYLDDQLSEFLKNALKIFPAVSRVHGSRDYFQANIEGIDYEFVPVKKIDKSEEAVNVTDSSPLHVQWMKNNIKKNKQLSDEIILTKLFCKALKIYGAESYIRGFSGHVIDILLVYYKTFENLLKATAHWEKGYVIDVENHNTAEEINSSKVTSLIVVDPIQPERNAAAALSIKNMNYFKQKAKEFLQKPSEKYFTKRPITVSYLESIKGENELFILEATPVETKVDIAGAKLLKAFDCIRKKIRSNDFNLVEADWEWDKKNNALFYFILKPEKLSKKKLREGPPVKAKENAKKFKEKYPDFWEEKGRLYAYAERQYTKAKDLIKDLIKTEYVNERVKKIKLKD